MIIKIAVFTIAPNTAVIMSITFSLEEISGQKTKYSLNDQKLNIKPLQDNLENQNKPVIYVFFPRVKTYN